MTAHAEGATYQVVTTGTWYKGVSRDLRSPSVDDHQLAYTPGTVVTALGLDDDPRHNCGAGINFVRTIAEALRWGPVVVRLEVPASELIIDTGDKLRARTVRVVGIVNLAGANLTGANLTDAYLVRANLTGANLTRAYLARANLTDAYLVRANLTDANLTRANLTGAYLAGAYLADANLADANLARAVGMPASGIPGGWALDTSGTWRPGGPS